MRKLILILTLLLASVVYADEVIVDYSEISLPILNNTLRRLRSDIDSASKVSTGVVAPTSTPKHIGDIYINTVLHKIYVSDGTSSSSNWVVLN